MLISGAFTVTVNVQPTAELVPSVPVIVTVVAVSYTHLDVYKRQTVTVAEAERFSVQAPSLTDTNLSVWFAVTPEIVTVAVPPVRVVVVLEPSLTLYVTTAPLVPIRVKMALLPAQMAEFVPLMVAVAAVSYTHLDVYKRQV